MLTACFPWELLSISVISAFGRDWRKLAFHIFFVFFWNLPFAKNSNFIFFLSGLGILQFCRKMSTLSQGHEAGKVTGKQDRFGTGQFIKTGKSILTVLLFHVQSPSHMRVFYSAQPHHLKACACWCSQPCLRQSSLSSWRTLASKRHWFSATPSTPLLRTGIGSNFPMFHILVQWLARSAFLLFQRSPLINDKGLYAKLDQIGAWWDSRDSESKPPKCLLD